MTSDTLNPIAINNTDAIALDPISQRLYFIDRSTSNPEILYLDPSTGNEFGTGANIISNSRIRAFGFNTVGVGYAISVNGDLYEINTNYSLSLIHISEPTRPY